MALAWWRKFQRWRRFKRAERLKIENPLREFLYLDEVSVYSLYASRFGPVAREFTDSSQATAQIEQSREAELTAGIKARIGRKATEGQTTTSQVLRKSIIQTTFKELADFERQHLLLSPASGVLPSIRATAEGVAKAVKSDAGGKLGLTGDQIVRGGLIEVDAVMEPADIYKVSSVFSSLSTMFRQSPGLFPAAPSNLDQIDAFVQVVDQLLVGLIPLQCRLTDYVAVLIDNETWIVHNGLLVDAPPVLRDAIRPLYVVGLTEAGSYWKDVRRVLFSKPVVRILARIESDRIIPEWNAVKLVDLLRDLSPQLADQVGAGMRTAVDTVRVAEGAQRRSMDAVRLARRNALRRYGALVATNVGTVFDADDVEFEAVIQANLAISGAEEWRRAYDNVADFICQLGDVQIAQSEALGLRQRASAEAGLTPGGELRTGSPAPPPGAGDREMARFLDCEIVAIYW
jgi:hypothetical protein